MQPKGVTSNVIAVGSTTAVLNLYSAATPLKTFQKLWQPPTIELITVYHQVQVDSRISRRVIFWGKNVSKIVGSNISRTRNSAKIRDPNDAKFHRSAHCTVESLVPQSTISPDMLVKDPKLVFKSN